MDLKRRTLLKGITATAAVSLVASHVTFANPIEDGLVSLRKSSASKITDKPITGVVSQAYKNSAFAQGLESAHPTKTVLLDQVNLAILTELLSQTSTNLVGIIDHANAAVLVQLTRTYNAKIHWLGQHSLQPNGNSHNILRSGNTDNCQENLVKDFSSCPAPHQVREQGLSTLKIVGKEEFQHTQQWAANLALALTDLKNPSPNYSQLKLTSKNQPIQGSALTFFIETC
jgi:hypothetical protein